MRVPVIDDRGQLRRRDDRERLRTGRRDRDRPATGRSARSPRPTSHNAEVDDLVHIEFDRPDLPWLFTPAGPDGNGRLVPWLTLVVAEARRDHVRRTPRRGPPGLDPPRPAPAARRRLGLGPRTGDGRQGRRPGRLPDPGAAAQRGQRRPQPVPAGLPAAAGRPHGVRRLRRADLPGRRQAGLGLSTGDSLAPAWGTAPDDFDCRRPGVDGRAAGVLLVAFATGEEGNFESLARKLKPPGRAARRRTAPGRRHAPVAR